jgi:hypothetical protein
MRKQETKEAEFLKKQKNRMKNVLSFKEEQMKQTEMKIPLKLLFFFR